MGMYDRTDAWVRDISLAGRKVLIDLAADGELVNSPLPDNDTRLIVTLKTAANNREVWRGQTTIKHLGTDRWGALVVTDFAVPGGRQIEMIASFTELPHHRSDRDSSNNSLKKMVGTPNGAIVTPALGPDP